MTYKHNNKDPNLNNLHHAMVYRDNEPHIRVDLGSDNITITGDVNILDNIRINNTEEQSIPVHLTDDPIAVTQSTSPWVISKDTNNNASNNPIYVNFTNGTIGVTGTFWQAIQPVSGTVTIQDGGNTITVDGTVTANVTFPTTQQVSGTVELGTTTLAALETINATVSGTVSIGSDGTVSLSAATLSALENINATVSGTVELGSTTLSALENINATISDGGGSITVDGTVTATITDVITVIAEEDPGELYAFNNHATNTNRGWTMDEVMRPVVSFQNGSASAADIIKIVEYEIGNNNANQSTIVYEWYEGPLTISGAAIPAWTTFGVHSQYRVYQDKYSSNQGNTFTVPAGTYMRHSGIIIGKNTSGDEGPANLRGGDSRNMLTLCMRRVDNATKLDVWFAFTVKELT